MVKREKKIRISGFRRNSLSCAHPEFPPFFLKSTPAKRCVCGPTRKKKAHSCSRAFVIFLRYVTLRDATNNTEGAQILKEKKTDLRETHQL